MLNHDARARIVRDVVLEIPPPADESPEAAAFRQEVERDKAAADKAGHMLDLPFDWDQPLPYQAPAQAAAAEPAPPVPPLQVGPPPAR
jgi:hypothetical protein